MADAADHATVLEAVAGLAMGRIRRDLDHIDETLDAIHLKDELASDVMTSISTISRDLHALAHRMDDDILRWAATEHVAAVLVESVTETTIEGESA